ncbi:MAG: MFS transporter [Capsulimonadales bacterium]|nr:MFS transporter [Capsulimonadales bacterium]
MTDETVSVGPTRRQQWALSIAMFLITGAFGFLQTFTSLYLSAAGLQLKEIGLVTALGTAVAIFLQPVLGRLSDRWDTRRPFMVLAALGSAGAYLLFRKAAGFEQFVLLTALGVNGSQYLNTVGGVLVGRMVRATGGGTAYVRYRLWGSVGYIVVALTTGGIVKAYLPENATLNRADLDPLFTYAPLLFLAIAVASLFVPDVKNPPPTDRDTAPEAIEPPRTPQEQANLRWFLTAFFLYQFSLYGASAYLPLFMKSLGASPLHITAMYAGGVLIEVAVMSQVGRWVDTYGRWPALAASFLLLPVRLLLYVPANSPLHVMAVQTLHGFNFGIIGTIAIVFVNDLARNHERGTIQSRLAVTQGIGVALGPVVCGFLSDRFGIPTMFAVMAGGALLTAAVFWTRVRETHPSPKPLPAGWRFLQGAPMRPSGDGSG